MADPKKEDPKKKPKPAGKGAKPENAAKQVAGSKGPPQQAPADQAGPPAGPMPPDPMQDSAGPPIPPMAGGLPDPMAGGPAGPGGPMADPSALSMGGDPFGGAPLPPMTGGDPLQALMGQAQGAGPSFPGAMQPDPSQNPMLQAMMLQMFLGGGGQPMPQEPTMAPGQPDPQGGLEQLLNMISMARAGVAGGSGVGHDAPPYGMAQGLSGSNGFGGY